MAKLIQNIREEIGGVALPFIAFGAALNLVLGQVIAFLKLPVYLDTVGTVLVAITIGPWAGILSGIMAAIIGGVYINPYLPYYIPTVIVVGGFSAFMARKGFFTTWPKTIFAGLLQGFAAAVVSAPITAYLFGGITLAGTSLIVAYLRFTGETLLKSVLFAGLAADPVDKTLTYVLSRLLVKRLPSSLTTYYPRTRYLGLEQ
ncbi:hypothetical protein MYX78_01070 [Acidobacteria bacterium AH-259-G07]|nr:hypothetical protein [Acidobacteria bacterium AH-259-G07]